MALNLNNNSITDAGAKYISEALESGNLNNLCKLDLGGTSITDNRGMLTAKALKCVNLKNLISLNLNSNSIRAESDIRCFKIWSFESLNGWNLSSNQSEKLMQ